MRPIKKFSQIYLPLLQMSQVSQREKKPFLRSKFWKDRPGRKFFLPKFIKKVLRWSLFFEEHVKVSVFDLSHYKNLKESFYQLFLRKIQKGIFFPFQTFWGIGEVEDGLNQAKLLFIQSNSNPPFKMLPFYPQKGLTHFQYNQKL